MTTTSVYIHITEFMGGEGGLILYDRQYLFVKWKETHMLIRPQSIFHHLVFDKYSPYFTLLLQDMVVVNMCLNLLHKKIDIISS